MNIIMNNNKNEAEKRKNNNNVDKYSCDSTACRVTFSRNKME